jgi:hypothetical protein
VLEAFLIQTAWMYSRPWTLWEVQFLRCWGCSSEIRVPSPAISPPTPPKKKKAWGPERVLAWQPLSSCLTPSFLVAGGEGQGNQLLWTEALGTRAFSSFPCFCLRVSLYSMESDGMISFPRHSWDPWSLSVELCTERIICCPANPPINVSFVPLGILFCSVL